MLAILLNTLPSSPAAGLDLLLALSLKATVVLAGAARATLAFRRASAAARHLMWSAALLGTLALPLLAIWGPGWSVKGFDLPKLAGRVPTAPEPATAPSAASEPKPATDPTPAPAAVAPTAPTTTAPFAKPADSPPASREPLDLAGLALMVWAVGAAAVMAWLLLGAWMLGRISRRALPVTDPEWVDLVERCADELGLRRPIHLATTDQVAVPCAWGVWQPQVLIPAVADSWSADRRRAVLLHELAHVARRDCLVQTLAQVACAMLWFHPLAWLASWRLRVERERACDDLVLGADTSATDYADHLLAVVRSLRQRRLTAIGEVAFARPSQLEGRLLAVLDPDQRRGALTARRAWSAALAAALTVLPLGALRPWTESAQAGGMTLTDAKHARPEDAAASRLVHAPEGAHGLAAKMNWAMSEGARQTTGYWVAYEIPRVGDASGNLSDSGPIELQTLSNRWPGARVADVLAGRTMRDAKVVPNRDLMVLAFHYPARTGRPEKVDRIRVQSQDLAAAFGRQPLFWLGDIDDHESLHWVSKLESGLSDSELRSAALHAVASHADDAAVRAHMVEVARSDAPAEVRASAVERLSRFHDGETVDLLVATLHQDRNHEVRNSAVQALGDMHSDKATRALSKLARDPNESTELRRDAIEALGDKANVQAEQTLDELIAGSEATPEPKKKDKSGSKTLFEDGTTLITPSPGGQDITVLDEQGRPEVTIKQHQGKQKAEKHSQEGRNGQDEQVDQEQIQRQAVESLSRLPEATSLPKLIRIGRTHPSVAVRRQAVQALGTIDGQKALDALVELAWQSSEEDEEVAREAVDALRERGGSLPRVIELAMKHKRTAVRRQAVQALGQGHEPQAIGALDDLIRDDSDQEVQREAVDAIAEQPEEISLPRLERIARSHPRVAVRRQAIDALGNFDPDKVAPILESLIGHEEKKSH